MSVPPAFACAAWAAALALTATSLVAVLGFLLVIFAVVYEELA